MVKVKELRLKGWTSLDRAKFYDFSFKSCNVKMKVGIIVVADKLTVSASSI